MYFTTCCFSIHRSLVHSETDNNEFYLISKGFAIYQYIMIINVNRKHKKKLSPLGLRPQTMIFPEIVTHRENTVISSASITNCFVRSKQLLMSPPHHHHKKQNKKKQTQKRNSSCYLSRSLWGSK